MKRRDIILATFFAFALSHSAIADLPSFPICTNAAKQWHPSVSGDTVVWDDARYPEGSIYGYNVSTSSEFPICTDGPAGQAWPAINADLVCWIDYQHNNNYDIYGYHLSTQNIFPVCTDGSLQHYSAISGDIVVWADKRSGADIYGYDLINQVEFHITSIYGSYHILPSISGDIIVWGDNRNGDFDIFGYDLGSQKEFLICDANAVENNPVHIDGNIVVWMDVRNGERDIYGYNLGTKTEFAICTGNGNQYWPAVSGNIVVWSDRRNDNYDIYGQDLSSGREFAICTNSAEQLRPAISGRLVVWEDYRNGNGDIYGTYIPAPPVADADGPYTIYVDDTLTLDASNSTDDDNDIVSYMWDLDDDGTFETDANDQAIFDVNYTYLHSLGLLVNNTYNIYLQVTDSEGQSDTNDTTLTIIPKPALQVAVDIKPGSCPNPMNVKSRGVLPVAILGSEIFDVGTIDATSIELAGVGVVRHNYEDVASPVSDINDCNCIQAGPDGYTDLTLKFKTQDIVEAIGDVNHGDILSLELIGVLFGERPIEGVDCIVIRGKHKQLNQADINKDGKVDMTDFAIFSKNWLQTSIEE